MHPSAFNIGIVCAYLVCLLFAGTESLAMAQNTSSPLLPNVPTEWQTHTEQTDYRETPRFAETIAFCQKMAAASRLLQYTTFGLSGEGRDLPLVIAARGDDFTPDRAKKDGKPVVMIQACIHAGESDGKDAGLALLRDIAITGARRELLDRVVILFIPIYNVDGHERFGPYNRINQNGPAEMGWRTTTANLNLNRDYMKADAPETRAWLKLWTAWSPDLFIDCHVTDGADFRYNVTYQYEHHENTPPPILAWERNAFEGRIVPATESAGNLLSWYLEFRDNRDFTKGIDDFIATPRFSTGYTPLRNRPGILVETHMLKSYRSRVRGTYDLLRFTLEEINRHPEELLRAVREADELTLKDGRVFDPSRKFPLRFEQTDQSMPYALKAVKYDRELSDVSGNVRVVYGPEPLNLTVPFYNSTRIVASVAPPLYYIVPPQWRNAIEVLSFHGLKTQRLQSLLSLDVEGYRFSDVKWASAPFEGRFMPSYKTTKVIEHRTFPAGSLLVPLSQTGANVAVHLLEPEAPDSLVAWGFFNAIFEQKEYGEDYVVEKLAREMLKADEKLRVEFEHRVATDREFAASSRERLQFFYERSPYHDPELNQYPVARVTSMLSLPSSEN